MRRRSSDLRRGAIAATLMVLFAGVGSCTGPCAGDAAPRLRLFAAASLVDVMTALAGDFEAAGVAASFGGSGALARQIRDGAPADVYVSASPDWIDDLREAGELAGEPVVVARNRLVAIAPAGGRLAASGVRDARALLGELQTGERVAIADPGVPAGEYARAALRRLGLLEAFERRLAGQRDARAVLHAVEQGELVAGFSYATDARGAGVEVLFEFDPALHPPIAYQAAALRAAPSPALARRFLVYLRSDAARTRLVEAGFALP